MHIGNGIICPVTGLTMLAVAGVTAFYAFKSAKKDFTKDKIKYTIGLTLLVFAMQMINFSIPETGSSGHIIGGILLASLLGPSIGFLAMCSILIIQSVFFSDGGLLALGCNIFNMGFIACFIAYPLIYKPLKDKSGTVFGAILASVIALQFGSIAVVAEGYISGTIPIDSISEFTKLMQTIHLPIGIIEGIITAVIIVLAKFISVKKLNWTFYGTALILAGVISQYASQKPDGLEWSLLNISDSIIMQTNGILYNILETIQSKTSIFALMPPILGNIAGLGAVGILMYLICKIINNQMIKAGSI